MQPDKYNALYGPECMIANWADDDESFLHPYYCIWQEHSIHHLFGGPSRTFV